MAKFEFEETDILGETKGYILNKCITEDDNEVSIPSSYKGHPVLIIASKSFDHCSSIKKIIVPNSIGAILHGAFSGCSSLEVISLPFIGTISEEDRNEDARISNHLGTIFGTTEFANSYQVFPEEETNLSFFIPKTLKRSHSNKCI